MTGHIIPTLLNMLRLRSGPQDLPGGWLLAVALALAYISQGFIADQIMGDSDGAPRSLVAIGLQFGMVALLLNLRQFQARVPQTLAALAGTGFVFGLLSLLILSRVDPGKPQPDLALMYLVLFGWSLLVDAHIYRHALSVKFGIGALLAVLIFAVTFMSLKTLFG
ncbi:MAG: hypothetical protein OES53_09985 [Xanthomonadales bacterium]|jgi:hypothetical protein|nr:hypothetical protein [Xanthomonadales bacterium]